jgi:hypothetical protein
MNGYNLVEIMAVGRTQSRREFLPIAALTPVWSVLLEE